jgi:hypothetical protein
VRDRWAPAVLADPFGDLKAVACEVGRPAEVVRATLLAEGARPGRLEVIVGLATVGVATWSEGVVVVDGTFSGTEGTDTVTWGAVSEVVVEAVTGTGTGAGATGTGTVCGSGIGDCGGWTGSGGGFSGSGGGVRESSVPPAEIGMESGPRDAPTNASPIFARRARTIARA